ncbi:hypothetical protein AB205_0179640 [Aquarana catesbeiana]|uniref:Uncharacterized protein n=1 Tax=Aquarana catesbeiana TaxID=8400 RepID=A0A2G9Q5P8_AQUCT|nr:hypothetical protein AB205_0179640 [Aquarana catesbeiana]
MFYGFLEKPNLEDAHSVPTCAICHQERSMDAFWGCNPFLNNKVTERKGFLPQNTSLDPPLWQVAHVDIRKFVCIFQIWLFLG